MKPASLNTHVSFVAYILREYRVGRSCRSNTVFHIRRTRDLCKKHGHSWRAVLQLARGRVIEARKEVAA